MHSTMGVAPALAQLNDTNMVNDLPSRVASSNDTNVPEDVIEADILADDGEDAGKMPKENIDDAIPPVQPMASDKTQGHS